MHNLTQPSEKPVVIYSRKEFAKLLGCSPETLKKWARKGLLVPYYKPSNRPFYTSEHLEEYLNSAKRKSLPTPQEQEKVTPQLTSRGL